MKNSTLLLVLMSSLPALFGCSTIKSVAAPAAITVQPFTKISHAANSARDFIELGHYHQGRNNLPAAVDAYCAAIGIESGNVDARTALGTVYAMQGRFDKALVEFKLAIESAPHDADLVNNLGFAYFLKKDFAEATASFEKAITLDPTNVRAYNNLGASRRETGESEASRLAFAKAAELGALRGGGNAAGHAMLAGDTRVQTSLGKASTMPAGVNIRPVGSDTGISLITSNQDASAINLQNPDALILKIESALRTASTSLSSSLSSGADAFQWKAVVSEAPVVRESAGSGLRLKMSTQISVGGTASYKTPAGNDVIILEPVSSNAAMQVKS